MARKEIKIRIIDAGEWLTGTGRHEIPQGTEKVVKDTLVARCATNTCGKFKECQPAVIVQNRNFSVWPSNKDTSEDKKRD